MPKAKTPSRPPGHARRPPALRVKDAETITSTLFSDPTGRVFYFNIIGPSMRPTLKPGDLLVVEPYRGNRIRLGDVVVFPAGHESHLITHRLFSRRGDIWRARGDNNSLVDPWPLTADDLIGRVVRIRRGMVTRRLASGGRGRIRGFLMRTTNATRATLFRLGRPVYRQVARWGLFRGILPDRDSLKIMSVTRPEGTELRLIWRKAVIGRLPPHHGRWWFRPPFRLLVDESRLPKPGPGRR
jgi:signal peptidase I